MPLCHLHELPDGASRGFDPQGAGRDTVLVVRRGQQLFAYANACPHHGTPMAWRKDQYLNAAGTHIVCGAHGAQFEVATGLCVLGPCLGEALSPVAVQIHANGEVHLAGPQRQETSP